MKKFEFLTEITLGILFQFILREIKNVDQCAYIYYQNFHTPIISQGVLRLGKTVDYSTHIQELN